jgi:hypothetical protein
MISIELQMFFAVIAVVVSLGGYLSAMKMGYVLKRNHINGSSGATVRTIKRREVVQMLKGTLLLIGAYIAYLWMITDGYDSPETVQVIVQRALTDTGVAILIALNVIWDYYDRKNNEEYRRSEKAVMKDELEKQIELSARLQETVIRLTAMLPSNSVPLPVDIHLSNIEKNTKDTAEALQTQTSTKVSEP